MTSLEMDDSAATDNNSDNSSNQDETATERGDSSNSLGISSSDSAWMRNCRNLGEQEINIDLPLPVDRPERVPSTRGRQANSPGDHNDSNNDGNYYHNESTDSNHNSSNHNDSDGDGQTDEAENGNASQSDEIDWHLPDHISVDRTSTGGYVVRIVHDDGTVTEEALNADEFSEFLQTHGWNIGDQTDETEHDWVDDERIHDHDMIDSDEWVHDWVELDPPSIELEILDDGTIIVVRESGDEITYDIIRTGEDGSTTIIRVTPWGTEIVSPHGERDHSMPRHRGDDSWGGEEMGPLFAQTGEMSEDQIRRCRENLPRGDMTSPTNRDVPVFALDIIGVDHPSTDRDENR